MTAIVIGDFPARPRADRNAFLVLTALVWVAVLPGFGSDSAARLLYSPAWKALSLHLIGH